MLKLNIDEIIARCSLKFNGRFRYFIEDCKEHTIKINVECPIHGRFLISLGNHLQSKDGGCLKCQREKHLKRYDKFKEDFVTRASTLHHNKYDYSKFNYVNNSIKGIIMCKEHGEFYQSAATHLKGQGCRKCCRATMGGYGGYCIKNAEKFKDKWKNINASIYVVNLYNEEESFIKIGITVQNNIIDRFRGVPYKRKILDFISGNLYELVSKEQGLLKIYNEYKYQPVLRFKGSRECFKIEVCKILNIRNI